MREAGMGTGAPGSDGASGMPLVIAVGETLTTAYFVLVFALFFTHADLYVNRSGLVSASPSMLYFALLSPLLILVLAADARNGFRGVFSVWRRNAAILLPLLALAMVGLFAAQLPEANWSGGGKYLIFPFYTLAGVMASMLLPLLGPVRRGFRLAVWLAFSALTVTLAADVVWPALFSKLPSRAAGLPGDSNAAAALLVLACALLLDWRRQRWRDAVLLAVTGAALVTTFSRAGFLLYGLLLVGTVAAVMRRHERWFSQLRKAMPIALALLAVVAGLALARTAAQEGAGMFGRHRARHRLEMFTGGESLLADSSDRSEIASTYLELIAEAPWLGRGTGFSYAQPKGPHVRLLQEWVNGGLAAVASWVAFFALALVLAYRRRRRSAMAFVLVLAAWSLFNHVFLEYRSVLLALGLVMTTSLPGLAARGEGRGESP